MLCAIVVADGYGYGYGLGAVRFVLLYRQLDAGKYQGKE
jgi:hypothetical protein